MTLGTGTGTGTHAPAPAPTPTPASAAPSGSSSPPPSPTYYPSFKPQPPAAPRSAQRYVGALLKPLLFPFIALGLPLWPILAAACAVPIIGVMAIPLLLLLSLALLYAIAWLAYLVLAQLDLPLTPRPWSPRNILPFLPISPLRCAKVDLAAIRYASAAVRIAFPAVFDWSYRRVMVLGTQKGARVVKEGILYGSPVSGKRLDVYMPPTPVPYEDAHAEVDQAPSPRSRRHSAVFPEDTFAGPAPAPAPASASASAAPSHLAPVVVVVPSMMAPLSWTSKRKLYLQLALRLRRLGYCVIVPDITYFPESRIKSSIIDLRLVLRWTARNCHRYGGDADAIHVLGHGLSAHLVMLTVAQEAVVLSREGHLDRAYEHERQQQRQDGDADADADEWTKSGEVGWVDEPSDTPPGAVPGSGSGSGSGSGFGSGGRRRDILASAAYRQAEQEVGNGLKRVEIYEPQIDLPPLAGVILLSGVSDVIKGFRSESERGLEHLSFLRRATGPSHIQCLLHSPAHLLYAAKNILDTRLLPPKFLLIHGGNDTVVPVEQSTLLKTLLVGIGVHSVRLRAYRHLGHAESIASLFLGMGKSNTRYTRQIIDDIAAFVQQ